MRENLRQRLIAMNGGGLAEDLPVSEAAPPKPKSPKRRSPTSATVAASAQTAEPKPESSSASLLLNLAEHAPSSDHSSCTLSELFPGYECDAGPHGKHYCVESRLRDVSPEWRRIDEGFLSRWNRSHSPRSGELKLLQRLQPDRLLFLDIETGGLGDSLVFLIGLMAWDGRGFVIQQLLARHDGEEAALLVAAQEALRCAGAALTYNGKSFDLPFIRNRCARYFPAAWEDLFHVDLLVHARKKWRGRVPNCRLQTLEEHLCGRKRVGDVPSREIPRVYRRYLSTGDPRPLSPVLHHNLLDLATMAELLLMLLESA